MTIFGGAIRIFRELWKILKVFKRVQREAKEEKKSRRTFVQSADQAAWKKRRAEDPLHYSG